MKRGVSPATGAADEHSQQHPRPGRQTLIRRTARFLFPYTPPKVSYSPRREHLVLGTGLGVLLIGMLLLTGATSSPSKEAVALNIRLPYAAEPSGDGALQAAPEPTQTATATGEPTPAAIAFSSQSQAQAVEPSTTPTVEPTPGPDPRVALTQAFLSGFPLYEYAEEFVAAADKYGIEWRLIPVIAMLESTAGIEACGYNAWGYASCEIYFASSWVEGAYFVAERLSEPPYAGLSTEAKLCVWVSGQHCTNPLALWYSNAAVPMFAQLDAVLSPPYWGGSKAEALALMGITEDSTGAAAAADETATPTATVETPTEPAGTPGDATTTPEGGTVTPSPDDTATGEATPATTATPEPTPEEATPTPAESPTAAATEPPEITEPFETLPRAAGDQSAAERAIEG